MVRHGLSAAAVVGLLFSTTAARADELTLTTQLGRWDDAVAALRADLGSEGRTLRISVRAGGVRVPCERYLLQLDEAAGSAFRATACDAATQETWLVLARRAALFDETHDVPRPRPVSITAILRATEVAQGGPQGGSLVRCSVAVRPYLDDVLHGTRVMLTPERYALRPGSASVTVSPDPGGWSVSTTERASFRFRYDVVDRATGEVVLREDASLSCGPDARPQPARSAVSSLEGHVAEVDAELAQLEREILLREVENARLSQQIDRMTPPRPAAPMSHASLISVGVTALASFVSAAAFMNVAPWVSDDGTRNGLYAAGAANMALGMAMGGIYLSQRVKMAMHPTLAISSRGTTLGAGFSF